MKKLLSILLVISLEFLSFSTVAYAQDATPSAGDQTNNTISQQASPSGELQTVTATASAAPVTDTTSTATNPFTDNTSAFQTPGQSISSLLNVSLGSSQTAGSAFVKQKSVIQSLQKKTYKSDESINLTVYNAQESDVTVSVTDARGNAIDNSLINKTTIGTQTNITIQPSQPGKYTIHVTNADGNTSTQDFTWGVLAINTNKSIYTPNEIAKIAMAVLDETGNMVCDAKVTMEIQNAPLHIDDILSTDNGKITVNPQCMSHAFSLTPDYEASYPLQGTGQYNVSLTATTKNGTNTINDAIKVVAAVPFDVERTTATRIFPGNRYPVLLHIKANQDFSGTVTDYAPANFDIQPYATDSAQVYNTSTLVIPGVDMQAQFGTTSLALAKPFIGNFPMIQGFGVSMTDPEEAPYYASFGLAGHDGLDFAMPSGTKILAADDGTVSLAGDGAYGTMVVLDHTWGRSYYGHLSKTEVTVGQHVLKGEEIGLSGATGHVTGPHLHFGIKPKNPNMSNGFYGKVDPTPYLNLLSGNAEVLGISTVTTGTTAEKVISWNVTMKKGDAIDLAYSYKAPGLSPELYTIGPLTLTENKTVVFQEARLWQIAVDANSTATANCSVSANDATDAGVTWSNTGTGTGACASATTSSATLGSIGGNNTEYLVAKTFGFSIPTNSKIVGIQFGIGKKCSVSSGSKHCNDRNVFLVKAGVVQTSGTDQKTATNWTTSNVVNTYGSTTSIPWGGSWGVSDINDTGFGVAFAGTGVGSSVFTATLTGFITATITYDAPPNAPSNIIPNDGATGQSTSPQFQMLATDPESDNLQYKVTIWSGSCGGTLVQTDNETSSQTGWSGQNATCSSGLDCYTSDGITRGTFNTQTALSAGTTYYWKASAIDPLGSNSFTDATSCSSFTTSSSGPRLDQLLRHGDWFDDSGVRQFFTF